MPELLLEFRWEVRESLLTRREATYDIMCGKHSRRLTQGFLSPASVRTNLLGTGALKSKYFAHSKWNLPKSTSSLKILKRIKHPSKAL